MTEEKHPRDRSEALENTLANSQEKKGFFSKVISRDEALRQKTYPFVAAGFCLFVLSRNLYFSGNGEPGDSVADVEVWFWILMCFVIMGACVKEQHDRIQKLETALAKTE